MKYHLEVDGLRAVAVISVLLFHAGFAVFSEALSALMFFCHQRLSHHDHYFGRVREGDVFSGEFLRASVSAHSVAVAWFTLLSDEYKNLGLLVLATSHVKLL